MGMGMIIIMMVSGHRPTRACPRAICPRSPLLATPCTRRGRCRPYWSSQTSSMRQPLKMLLTIDGQALDRGLPAGGAAVVEDDRPGAVLGQPSLDLPDQLLALFLVGFARLLDRSACRPRGCSNRYSCDRRRNRSSRRAVWSGSSTEVPVRFERDRVVLAHDLGVPLRRVDRLELARRYRSPSAGRSG